MADVLRPHDTLGLWVPAFAGTTWGGSLRASSPSIRNRHVSHELRLAHLLSGEGRALLEPGARSGGAPQRLAARVLERPAQRGVVVVHGEVVACVELEPMAVGV